jgi:hypothetical protein
VSAFVRILPDSSEARALHANPEDRGWRLRLEREDGLANAYLHEEQVFPERVQRADAQHFRDQRSILLRVDEQRWLRDGLSEMLGEVVDVEGWREEIRRARSGDPSLAMDRLSATRALCNYLIHDCYPDVGPTPPTPSRSLTRQPLQMSTALVVLAILDGRELRDCPSCWHPAHYHTPNDKRWSGRRRCTGPDDCRCTRTCEQVIESAAPAPRRYGSSAAVSCHDCPAHLELSRATTEQPSHEDDYQLLMPALDTAAVLLGWRLYKSCWWCPSHVFDKKLACARCLVACSECSCVGGPHAHAVDGADEAESP